MSENEKDGCCHLQERSEQTREILGSIDMPAKEGRDLLFTANT